MHINCVILTTASSLQLVSLEHLPGGNAQDYKQYIHECISNLGKIHSLSIGVSVTDSSQTIISKIKSFLMNQVPVMLFSVFFFIGERVEHKRNQTEL